MKTRRLLGLLMVLFSIGQIFGGAYNVYYYSRYLGFAPNNDDAYFRLMLFNGMQGVFLLAAYLLVLLGGLFLLSRGRIPLGISLPACIFLGLAIIASVLSGLAVGFYASPEYLPRLLCQYFLPSAMPLVCMIVLASTMAKPENGFPANQPPYTGYPSFTGYTAGAPGQPAPVALPQSGAFPQPATPIAPQGQNPPAGPTQP